jgi:hypothetical protein
VCLLLYFKLFPPAALSLSVSTSAYFNFIDLIILQLRANTALTLGLASFCKAVNRFSLHRLLPNKKNNIRAFLGTDLEKEHDKYNVRKKKNNSRGREEY